MAITTIEDALADMAQKLTGAQMVQQARDAVASGGVLEIAILVSPAKQGAAVTMHSLIASDRQSHGRLIRLK